MQMQGDQAMMTKLSWLQQEGQDIIKEGKMTLEEVGSDDKIMNDETGHKKRERATGTRKSRKSNNRKGK